MDRELDDSTAITKDWQRAVQRNYRCTVAHRATVHVRETSEGRVVWEGPVGVFELRDHPSASLAYAVGAPPLYTFLHAGLVDSPGAAARAMVAHVFRERERA